MTDEQRTYVDSKGEVQTTDMRNIHERFRWWDHEDIVNTLRENSFPLINIFCNIQGDFNLSTAVRNANWFNLQEVWVAGRRRWDKRGAVGTHHYADMKYAPDTTEIFATLRASGYRLVAAEIADGAVPLDTYQWQEKTAVIYGEEGPGLSQEILDEVDDIVFIRGFGTVRSLNVGTTSGIFCYDYTAKMSPPA